MRAHTCSAAAAVTALLFAVTSAAGARTSTSHAVLLVGTWHGHRGGYASIQAAVNAAKPGDWILVAPGDYREGQGRRDGVRVTTPDIHIRGLNRSGVIVDGTRHGAPRACAPQARWRNLGPGGLGRSGIVVAASGVSVDNLTVCNFVGGRQGRQIAFDGGYGSGRFGLGAYEGSYLTATSTYATRKQPALYGIFVSNASGPGRISHSYTSNMADSALHIGACPDCNAVFDHDTAEHSVIAFSAINAGGRLTIENSVLRDNTSGLDLASEEDESSPPPQDGACATGQHGPFAGNPDSCTVVEHNLIENNNDPNVPGGEGGVLRLIGAGIVLAGGRNDTVVGNVIRDQGAYGVVQTPFPWIGRPTTPNANCQGGTALTLQQTPVCFFETNGNVVTGNAFHHDGFFANPTNGALADAGATRFFGPLGIQIACATEAFGPCADGGIERMLQTLIGLGHALNVDSSALSGPGASRIPVRYPQLTAVTAPLPAAQPSMPNPCAGVPRNAWCSPG